MMSRAHATEAYLTEKDSPVPEKESKSGEYEFLSLSLLV
jgi:hypothetical protein